MSDKKTAKELHKRLKGAKHFKRRYDFASVTTRMYDDLCKECKLKVWRLKQRNRRVDYTRLCPKCQALAKEYEEDFNNTLR